MRRALPLCLLLAHSLAVLAQSASAPALVSGTELTKIMPTSYFFRGLSASVQARNSAALKYSDGFYVLAALVDTSGYSSDIKAKYTGLFITEKPLTFGGQTLLPGEYGMGFNADGKFHVMDVGANELLAAYAPKDTKMTRPVPLQFVVENGQVHLYLGRNAVTFSAR